MNDGSRDLTMTIPYGLVTNWSVFSLFPNGAYRAAAEGLGEK